MIQVLQTAFELQNVCEQAGWKFCFIGGVALQRWGEPRFADDVDITLYTGFGGEEPVIEQLLRRFEARIDGVAEFASRNRVLLLKSKTGVGIDVALGGIPFEEQMIRRAPIFCTRPK